MHRIVTTFFLLSAFLVAPRSMPGASARADNAIPVDPEVLAGADKYLNAVLAGDAGSVAAMFREDAALMPSGCPLLRGRSAIERYYRDWLSSQAKVTAFTFTHLESPVLGDTAFDVGTYKQTLALGSARTVSVSGKYTVILKRTGGEWMIAYLIFNDDSPSKMRSTASGSR